MLALLASCLTGVLFVCFITAEFELLLKVVLFYSAKIIIISELCKKMAQTLNETGGIGTTIIYICGAILVIGAGVLLVVRRKNNK